MQLPHPTNGGVPIAGGVEQFSVETQELLDEWEKVTHEAVAAVGLKRPKYLVDTKMLVAKPKKGLQGVHLDTGRGHAAHTQLVCILICSSGSHATALPLFPFNCDLSFSHEPQTMQRVFHLLQPEHYHDDPNDYAVVGEVVVFRLSTPHFGVANRMQKNNRVVLFGLLSHMKGNGQDELQVYPWLYARDAFGEDSPEYAQSLVDGRAFKPLDRLAKDERGRSSHKIAAELLKKYGLFDAYHATTKAKK